MQFQWLGPPEEFRRYSQIPDERWGGQHTRRVCVVAVANDQSGAPEGWESAFQRLAATGGEPEALVMLLTADVGVSVHSVLQLAEEASLQFVAVIPVEDENVSTALIAIPTEGPIFRWHDLGAPTVP
ncbi:MAG: hypothetical protein ACRDU9_09025, partial [Acidimicrobiia bacterium]